MTTDGSPDRYDFFDPWGGEEEPDTSAEKASAPPRWRPVRTSIPSPWGASVPHSPSPVSPLEPVLARQEILAAKEAEPPGPPAAGPQPADAGPTSDPDVVQPAPASPPSASAARAPHGPSLPRPGAVEGPAPLDSGSRSLGSGDGPPKQLAASTAPQPPSGLGSVEDLAAVLAGLPMPPLSVPPEPLAKLKRVPTVLRPEDVSEAPPFSKPPTAGPKAPPTAEAPPGSPFRTGPESSSLEATFVPRLPVASRPVKKLWELSDEETRTTPGPGVAPERAVDPGPLSESLRATFVPRLPSAPRKASATPRRRPEPMRATVAPGPTGKSGIEEPSAAIEAPPEEPVSEVPDVSEAPPAAPTGEPTLAEPTSAPVATPAEPVPAERTSDPAPPPAEPVLAERTSDPAASPEEGVLEEPSGFGPPAPPPPVRRPTRVAPVVEAPLEARGTSDTAGDGASEEDEEEPLPPPLPPVPTDPAEFLREIGVPLIHHVTNRVNAAGHRTAVQDLLDLEPPVLRLVLWPRRGPMDPKYRTGQATLDLTLETATPAVTARYWYEKAEHEALLQARVPPHALRTDWLETQVMDFLARALGRA